MVIINNISSAEWNLILSSLRSELRNGTMNEIFPKRQEAIRKLIIKIEGDNTYPFKFDLNDKRRTKYEYNRQTNLD